MPSFCPQCGIVLEEGAKFCGECGTLVSGKGPQGTSLSRRTLSWIVLFLILALGAGTLLFSVNLRPILIGQKRLQVSSNWLNKNPEDARRELGQLGIQYTPEAFVQAIQNGDILAIELFLASGMTPNAIDENGIPTLIWAAMSDHTKIVKALLAHRDTNLDVKTRSGWTALMFTAQRGHIDTLQLLLSKGADVNVKNPEGQTALILAAQAGHRSVVDALLAKGADMDAQDNPGQTALMLAAKYGKNDVVQTLLKKGANIHTKDHGGWDAFQYTIAYSWPSTALLLTKAGAGDTTALIAAAAKGYTDIIQALLDNGVDVNAKDTKGGTALLSASCNGHVSSVQALLKKGADVNAKDKDGDTALMCATRWLHFPVVQLLEQATIRQAGGESSGGALLGSQDPRKPSGQR